MRREPIWPTCPWLSALHWSTLTYSLGQSWHQCGGGRSPSGWRRPSNPNVCFTVARQSGQVRRHAEGDPCHLDSDSVICYGKARIIEDVQERQVVLNEFNRSFNPDAEDITLESAAKCSAVVIDITEMTGQRERERETIYWRYVP